MLELRPNCELCDRDLPPESAHARICTYECTFCAQCVQETLRNVCPNCGGGFVPRPLRPKTAWRANVALSFDPPSTRRRHSPYSPDELEAFVDPIADIDPAER